MFVVGLRLTALFFMSCLLLLTGCSEPANPASQADAKSGTPLDVPAPLPQPKVFIPQRADPQIVRGDNGRYYFIATAPEFDRIELRAADSLQDLASAQPQVIWRKHSSGIMGANIWAPELHRFNNSWYIYFAAGDAEQPGHIRIYVLANTNDDPLTGEWAELGRLHTARDSFSLDATTFEHAGQRYLVWAQKDPDNKFNSALYLAKLESPTQVGDVEIELSRPVLDWETQGFKVNEGPAVIEHQGKIFISYSASATDDRYAMGLLWAHTRTNLMDPLAWHKSSVPVFFTNAKLHRFGPGHNSFTLAEDGKSPLLVYHARVTQTLDGSPLSDPNRHTFVRPLQWTAEGFPDFGQDLFNDF